MLNEEAWALIRKAYKLDERGVHAEAVDYYDQALAIDLFNSFAWAGKGNSLESIGPPGNGLECLTKALEVDPKDDYALASMGRCQYRLGNTQEALGYLDEATKLHFHNKEAWLEKAHIYECIGQNRKADKCRKSAQKFDKESYIDWFELAGQHINNGNHLKAIECLDKSIRLAPDFAKAWHLRGLSLGNLGRFEDAVRSLKCSLECYSDAITRIIPTPETKELNDTDIRQVKDLIREWET
jgi:tetratricopeptide (TPR) repeat protein